MEKDGKEKIIETTSVQKTEPASQEQIKKENKLFGNIVIVMVGFILMFFAVYMIINSMRHFNVQGVNFEIVKEGQLTLYKTALPVIHNGDLATYNFYFRIDPRTLKSRVPIVGGNITFRKNLVLDVTTNDLYCGGDWAIGLVNMQHLYEIMGVNLLVRNRTQMYNPASDYMFVTINEGNKTEIKKLIINAYDINIAKCEVLPAFERLMLETFIRDKELNNK